MSELERKQTQAPQAKSDESLDKASMVCRILAAATLRRIGIDVACVVKSWE